MPRHPRRCQSLRLVARPQLHVAVVAPAVDAAAAQQGTSVTTSCGEGHDSWVRRRRHGGVYYHILNESYLVIYLVTYIETPRRKSPWRYDRLSINIVIKSLMTRYSHQKCRSTIGMLSDDNFNMPYGDEISSLLTRGCRSWFLRLGGGLQPRDQLCQAFEPALV